MPGYYEKDIEVLSELGVSAAPKMRNPTSAHQDNDCHLCYGLALSH